MLSARSPRPCRTTHTGSGLPAAVTGRPGSTPGGYAITQSVDRPPTAREVKEPRRILPGAAGDPVGTVPGAPPWPNALASATRPGTISCCTRNPAPASPAPAPISVPSSIERRVGPRPESAPEPEGAPTETSGAETSPPA